MMAKPAKDNICSNYQLIIVQLDRFNEMEEKQK